MTPELLQQYMKAYPCKLLETGNIRTCPVRLTMPYVFTPAKPMQEGQDAKYTVRLLFPKGADLSVLINAAKEVAVANHTGSMSGLHMPIRDQGEKEEYEGFEEGAFFFNCSSKKRPAVVDRKMQPITDPAEIYSGCWALVTVRPFWFKAPVKKGVSFGLQNVQKIADDERLGGVGTSAADDFAPVEIEEAPAAIDALWG